MIYLYVLFSLLLCPRAQAQEESLILSNRCLLLDPEYSAQEDWIPGYNKPANIDVWSDYDKLFTSGSFLYFQAIEDGLALGLLQPSAQTLFDQSPNSSLLTIEFPFQPGFRVGLGLHLGDRDWDFYAEYTWFRQQEASAFSAPSGGSIEPLWLYDLVSEEPATSATSDWHFSLDMIDGELGTSYYLSAENVVRPFWGSRLAWISQTFSPAYTISGETVEARNKIRSWGLGLRAGVDTEWHVGPNTKLLANGAFSSLYTHYKLSVEQQSFENPQQTAIATYETPDYLRPQYESAFGLAWGNYLFNSLCHFEIRALYELHVFWNQNIFGSAFGGIVNRSAKGSTNLYLHGLTVKMRLDF